MYGRIREEGNGRSRVMEYAGALLDGIGPRLTGSPNMKKANEWARDQLKAMGCSNARLESWGEFGMGWRQRHTWVRMTAPDTAVFIAQAAPWSPATRGPVSAPVTAIELENEKDFERYRGKLAGKIVLLGKTPPAVPLTTPLFRRFEEKDLADFARYPLDGPPSEQKQPPYAEYFAFREKIGRFLASENAAAVILPSGITPRAAPVAEPFTSTATRPLDGSRTSASRPCRSPRVILAVEHYGRLSRLLKREVPVTIEMHVDTEFTGDHEQGFNTLAEIPGQDPDRKDQVVILGAHLDSWAGGTGATDNGAGVVVVLEAMRILNALQVNPHRTIRAALWSGEEQGSLGSEVT
jgi:hypothetical protein